ncbi:MAG: L,D-transpeptidase [Lachnospiraceae bacterium]|nr:L,D-transpeptidase [Lachnospiraceae bacterium]
MYKRIFAGLLAILLIVQIIGCARQTSNGDVTTTTEETTTATTTETTTEETTTEEVKELTPDDVLAMMNESMTGVNYISGVAQLTVEEGKDEDVKQTMFDGEYEATRVAPVMHTSGQLIVGDDTKGRETFISAVDETQVKVMRLSGTTWSKKTQDATEVHPSKAEDLLTLLTMPTFTEVAEQTEEEKDVYVLTGTMDAETLATFHTQAGLMSELDKAPDLTELGANVVLTVDAETARPISLRVVTHKEEEEKPLTVTTFLTFEGADNTKVVNVPEDEIDKAITAQKEAEEKKKNEKTNVWVDVDLTKQYVYLYKNGEVIASSPCVSGCVADGNGTPTGTYRIAYKATDRTLRGTNRDGTKYESFVKYWMPFNGSIGLHDASWRSSFAATRAWNNGSHGCVNLPSKFAKTLYDTVSAGDVVVVHGWPTGSHEHTFKDWTVDTPATCKTEGKEVHKCTGCGKIVNYRVLKIDPDAHVWDKGKVTKEATTTSEGTMTYTCTLCGKTKTEAIPKKEEATTTTTSTTTTTTTTTTSTTTSTTTTTTSTTTTTTETTTEATTTETTTTETTTQDPGTGGGGGSEDPDPGDGGGGSEEPGPGEGGENP